MKAKPILFSGDMVNAIFDGKKTQTRRVIKPHSNYAQIDYLGGGGKQNPDWNNPEAWGYEDGYGDFYTLKNDDRRQQIACPYGNKSDLLWVRETFVIEGEDDYEPVRLVPHYRADVVGPHIVPRDLEDTSDDRTKWKPSIFMPRWASRLTLEIIDIRVERLQDISKQDALAEGVSRTNSSIGGYAEERFKRLWQSINGQQSWNANPWVWVIEFTPHLINVDDYIKRKQEASV